MSKSVLELDRGATSPSVALKAEVEDAMAADHYRMVYPRIVGDGLVKALNRAGLKAKSTFELTAMVRAYLLTGTLP